ncbi:MAG: SAM-dependent methyltransferase [Methyloceanibacter sp.]|jgi:methyltransferase (TIGR00027 family)
MSEVREVTGTAFVVAEFRARENDEAHPLYTDRVVPIFLDERTRAAADRIRADFPAGEHMPRLRTRYYDDRLGEQIAQGCKQVVILGSGLDTRPVRKAAPGVAYFEIDDAGTLDLKRARYSETGTDARVTLISANYVTSGVIALLEANGFDRGLPSFFIWEGNTMYLTPTHVMKVLNDLKDNVRRFAISFDYMDEAVVGMTTGEEGATAFVERFAGMGAPWTYGLDDLPALAREAGLAVADATTVGKLFRLYWPDRPMQSVIYDHYGLCTLRSPAV